ncbi:uncharacterized protein K452DRAFT_285463 [Aplosporella prunicola CBS 121167]|uniref:Ubiquitin carboxyl-terminal hydrolase 19 n=1 Tax=Aplosporella prunicola CBS 121167 TaxID=1176127 RepID=A0A6A6BLN1_9PEZI|nr:uncharacterized protein K452DRAFT_285463 [Aplosporella prunicola CBS 121167]KAF2144215.1 hypothetical protein K452DRAFT_285463 [Aplosporella prunicola CBS 121167]
MDLLPRSGSSLGGHPMTERSYSHKSDGRQSSAAASVHSATSGRANSMGADSIFAVGTPASEVPRLAPGLFILGSVPAIIRCWLNTNFKHDSLLYAAVCTGSYTSCLDIALINRLGFAPHITRDEDGTRKIKLELYLPEAVPYPASSRSSSPAPQLPSLTVDFTVVETVADTSGSKPIQVFLGSDMLRAHNADVLFSSNTLTLFDDERSKLSIPLVRPEEERTFKSLQVTSAPLASMAKPQSRDPSTNSFDRSEHADKSASQSTEAIPGLKAASPTRTASDSDRNVTVPSSDDGTVSTNDRTRPSLSYIGRSNTDQRDAGAASTDTEPNSARPGAIWSNWRRNGTDADKPDAAAVAGTRPDAPPPTDWASLGRAGNAANSTGSGGGAPRREGIKVLRPIRTASRVASGTGTGHQQQQPQPPASAGLQGQGQWPGQGQGQSRFFDEGRRRVTSVSGASFFNREVTDPLLKRSGSGEGAGGKSGAAGGGGKEVSGKDAAGGKPRASNPVGGASAFAWLNNAGGAR